MRHAAQDLLLTAPAPGRPRGRGTPVGGCCGGLGGARATTWLGWAPVRLVIARCRADYAGRLSAHLPLALRLLIVKADGSVLVHSDGGSYKPLNWMSPPCLLNEQPGRWVVTGKSGEALTIDIEEILSDTSFDLGVDPGLRKAGAASHLQHLPAPPVHPPDHSTRPPR